MRRVLGNDGNFLAWSLPLFSVAGIRVRLHLFFLIYIASELIVSMRGSVAHTAIQLFTLFTLVLLHEFGHCFACRWVRGEANEIIMWPLGGLAMCAPPHHPRANLITTVGGPMVNVLLIPVLGAGLLAIGAPMSALLPNLFSPTFETWLNASGNAAYYARYALWSAYLTNIYLLLFNVLLPMFPMDCGRIIQELLWFKIGYRRSMQIAVNLGLGCAIVVGVIAMSIMSAGGRSASTLLAIAMFCGIHCWFERSRLAMMEPEGIPGYDFSRGFRGMPGAGDDERPAKRSGPSKSELKRAEEEREHLQQVDQILEKIRTEGMASLTKREKAVLSRETEKKRRQAAGG